MNIFDLFIKKINDMPLFIKQLVYSKLLDEMKGYNCDDILKEGESFAVYSPLLTFKGKTELKDRVSGFDGNIYNFLSYCAKGYSIAEISVGMFLTMEEVSKYFVKCLEDGFLENSVSKDLVATAEYLSGKIRLGEYLVKIGKVTEDALFRVLEMQNKNGGKFGEQLIELGYIKYEDMKSILKLKSEAQKRFVLDYGNVPTSKTDGDSEELQSLKEENKRLKTKLKMLLEIVK